MFMKKFLLPESGTFYKSNLHCHSTISDGGWTPEQIKEEYAKRGYSIVAYTDHDIMLTHHDLTDEKFLALTGFEMEFNLYKDGTVPKTCHICFIALNPEQRKQPNWHERYLFGNAPKYKDQVEVYEDETPLFRRYTPECINGAIKNAREKGFFITYNHPVWSLETGENYNAYEGMHAMEICNFGCIVAGYLDYAPQAYDEMLAHGKRIYCTATDDNHNRFPADHPRTGSFGGFTMIKADKLEYRTITKALEDGNFYASQGPEIYDLWFEDDMIHVTCSPAERVMLTCGRRRADIALQSDTGEPVTHAAFKIFPEDKYVRLTVVNEKGLPANTNAYFTDELFD